MIELDFLVSPEVMVGTAGSRVNVVIGPSPVVFPDHEGYVSVRLETAGRPPVVLADTARVIRTALAIDTAIEVMGRRVGGVLDREIARKKKVLGT
jgi:hypothetical protein